MANYCINCIYFYDANEPRKSLVGAYGLHDLCRSKDIPVTDFVRGLTNPTLVNIDGKCSFYSEKAVLDIGKEDKIGS